MSTRTTTVIGRPGFVVDPSSIEQNPGRQIDWANVAAGYIDAATGKKVLPAGTVIGELLGSGKISPRVVTTNPATGILATTAIEGDRSAALSGYGVMVGGVIYEALLPDSSGSPKVLAAAIKTELAAADCTFKWERYEDNRAV
jgi:hypothetical protein